jgi:hypothetical protein
MSPGCFLAITILTPALSALLCAAAALQEVAHDLWLLSVSSSLLIIVTHQA